MPASPPALTINLSHHFLIAMPGMDDERFSRTVVYVCEHNERGALGLCINKPLEMGVEDLFVQGNMPLKRIDLLGQHLCWGGPMQPERGFILHTALPEADDARLEYISSLRTADGLQMTTSKDVLQALSEGAGPAQVFVALGYTAWGPGQLEDEIRHNSWLTVLAEHALIFEAPMDERYDRAMLLLGVQPWALAAQAGTA